MDAVPRERFVLPGRERHSPISTRTSLSATGRAARCMLTPMVQARLIQALEIGPGDGGARCCLRSRLFLGGPVGARREGDGPRSRRSPRRRRARTCPAPAGMRRASRSCAGRSTAGCPSGAPYDAVLVNGSVDVRPDTLAAAAFRWRPARLRPGPRPVRPRRRSTSARARPSGCAQPLRCGRARAFGLPAEAGFVF